MKRNNLNILLVVLLIIMAAGARIINARLHMPNFAPLAAISLFSGFIIKDKRGLAFLVPIFGQLFADLYFQFFTAIPGFYDFAGQLCNYAGLVAATVLGTRMVAKPVNALAYTFGASTLFFIISNFGYYLGGWNTYSFAGLIKSYADGIPFFKYTIAGDMAGGVLLFGSYFLATQAFAKKTQQASI